MTHPAHTTPTHDQRLLFRISSAFVVYLQFYTSQSHLTMPDARRAKFRTAHKFGRSRRRGKKSSQRKNQSQTGPVETGDLSTQTVVPIDSISIPSTSSSTHSDNVARNQSETVRSATKLQFFKRKRESSEEESDTEEGGNAVDDTSAGLTGNEGINFIVNLTCLQSMMTASGALCPRCCEPSLVVHEGGRGMRKGSSCYLEFHCSSCGKLSGDWTSQRTGIVYTGFDINRRIVAAATSTGMGFADTKRFFGLMGMPPPMDVSTWYSYKEKLHAGAKRAAHKHLQHAADQVRRTYADMNIGIPDKDGILNISVSVDGSWQKRGRTSHNGIVAVIEIMSGLVVDFETLSNFCEVCEKGPSPDDNRYQAWLDNHRNKCQKNVDCSSAAMEVEGTLIIFRRSIQLHNFRYTEMLGDGDTKTYHALLEKDVYNGYPIEKIECVNHVTKRMGTALRLLVEKQKAVKEPIGGRGKLTENRIKKLTNYYGKAIKDNSGDLEGMKNAVWATFFHSLSSDQSHNHSLCPAGSTSWCFFQRALANNAQPPPHKPQLPINVGEAMRPVYERLGDPQLLRRCLAGKTQNANESFHSLMWRSCPKERWANMRTVDTALALAVQRFNKGSSALLDMMLELELITGACSKEYAEQEDSMRVQTATRKSSIKAKERRKRIENIRRQERQDKQDHEGEVYGAGQF